MDRDVSTAQCRKRIIYNSYNLCQKFVKIVERAPKSGVNFNILNNLQRSIPMWNAAERSTSQYHLRQRVVDLSVSTTSVPSA